MHPNALYCLLTWFSPAFPTGGFSYSHGLETAVSRGLVIDAMQLCEWITEMLEHGAGRIDAAFLAAAYSTASEEDWSGFETVSDNAVAQRASAETLLEATAQGSAFMRAARAAWPHPWINKQSERPIVHSVAVGLTAAAHKVRLADALLAWLHGFSAGLVSAGVRLIPLGQTDGQRVQAALEASVRHTADYAERNGSLELQGASTLVADWCAVAHETQYTRLFRS